MTGNEALKAALIAYSEEYFSQYDIPADEKPHRFSLAYRIRKISVKRLSMKIERAARVSSPGKSAAVKRYIPLKKLAVIMTVMFSAVFLTAATGAVYFGARGFLFDVHDTYSDVSVDFSMYDIKDTIEEVYRLPEGSGYELVNETADDEIVNSKYKCGDKTITLSQYAKTFALNLMTNTENSEVYEVEVNGEVGFVLTHRSNNFDNLIAITWIHNGYVFEIAGAVVDKEELLRLAELVEIK